VLQLPGDLTAQLFLARHWQKKPLFMPQALAAIRPAVTRNELAWLATEEDVESRIVFTERGKKRSRYRVENGPFDATYLQSLPKRDWSLLVHDVEKHLPAMRKIFRHVPFVPDWRIDDLMISFAAPGGGVGPHRDNYDVFLCQGIGIRDWQYSTARVANDAEASEDLRLLKEFPATARHKTRLGDVLYLPPGVAHWGTARRACMTYSIGMRAPTDYADPDLQLDEIRPGYLSPAALRRAAKQASSIGCEVTDVKEWLRPTAPSNDEIESLLNNPSALRRLRLHGMTRIAFDDTSLYVNGAKRTFEDFARHAIGDLCAQRKLDAPLVARLESHYLHWLLAQGTFELPDNS